MQLLLNSIKLDEFNTSNFTEPFIFLNIFKIVEIGSLIQNGKNKLFLFMIVYNVQYTGCKQNPCFNIPHIYNLFFNHSIFIKLYSQSARGQ